MTSPAEPAPAPAASPVPLSQFGPITPIVSPTTPLPDASPHLYPGASPISIPTASYSSNQPQQNVQYSTPYVFADEKTRAVSGGQCSISQPMSPIQSHPKIPTQPQATAQMAYANQPSLDHTMSPNQTAPTQLSPELDAHRAAQLKAEKAERRKEQAKDCGAATCVCLGVTCLAVSAAVVMAMECFVCCVDALTYY